MSDASGNGHLTPEDEARLVVAVDTLWGWMPSGQVKEIQANFPELAELCMKVHHARWHATSHEERMMRRVTGDPLEDEHTSYLEGCRCPDCERFDQAVDMTDTRLDRLAELLCTDSEGEGHWQEAIELVPENDHHKQANDEFIEAWRDRARYTLRKVQEAGYGIT